MLRRISCWFGIIFVIVSLLGLSLTSAAQKSSRWAKKGTVFPSSCPPFTGCESLRILSPNGKSAIEVTYKAGVQHVYPLGDIDFREVSLRVTSSGRFLGEIQPVGEAENEITWSPDSKAFFINGSDNSYTENPVAFHYLDDPNLGPGYDTDAVARDMVRSFPPCKVKNPSETCGEEAANPKDFINAVGIDWIRGSSRVVVMAEVPCSTYMGGVMCQVLGYELSMPSGKIVRRMEPKEFAQRWQRSMAWTFRIPEPAEFEK
jgi:hypothetical protein